MRRFFESIIQPLLERIRPQRIVEIGIAEGGHSTLLASWCQEHGSCLDLIDTAPRFDTATFLARFGSVAQIHVGRSLDILPRLTRADVVCIDGDHNWYTVYHELKLLFENGNQPVCILHDTGWPYGRRDLYYDPANIPEEYRHHWQRGPLTSDNPGIADFGINPQLCHAVQEGGAKNGVQTAIDDFVAEAPSLYRVVELPVLFGLTIIAPVNLLSEGSPLKAFLDCLELSPAWKALLGIEERERCYGITAAQRLGPLPPTPSTPYAAPVAGRPFSPNLPAEILARIQSGTMRYRYRDRALHKNPFDLALYLRLLGEFRPGTVLEVGTWEGGSALWFADMMTALGLESRVITVDHQARDVPRDPRINFLLGDAVDLRSSISPDLLRRLPHPWLVVEDSAHTYDVSLAVLEFFDAYLHPGDVIVIEDGVVRGLAGEQYLRYQDGPSRAIEAFLAVRGADYQIDVETCDFFGFNVTYNPNGWLRRR